MKFHTLTVKEVVRETEDSVSVAFQPAPDMKADYNFVPGQYLTLKTEIGGEEVRRSYSICSHPDEPLRVAIKEVKDGVFSTWANRSLDAGMTIDVSTPEGNFIHESESENAHHYVAFAAGSGITPVLSIMKSVLQDEPSSSFTLFYGNRTTLEIIFKEELEALKNQYMDRLQLYHLLSRELTDSPLLSGRIDAENCAKYFKYFIPESDVAKVFLCGPYEMIMSMREALEQHGIDSNKIKFELFYNPETEEEKNKQVVELDTDHRIKITLDGVTSELSSKLDMTILDLAIEAGMDLPFSCKGGVCATCKAKVLDGTVDMTTNFALEEEEVEQGYVLTCQAHAKTDYVEVSFDA